MPMTQNGVEGRTKKDKKICVKAEHFITKSAGDGCASDSARNTGMEEEGKSTRNQTGKTNINVIPQLVDRRKASAFTRNVE